jgi:hypothetical protein
MITERNTVFCTFALFVAISTAHAQRSSIASAPTFSNSTHKNGIEQHRVYCLDRFETKQLSEKSVLASNGFLLSGEGKVLAREHAKQFENLAYRGIGSCSIWSPLFSIATSTNVFFTGVPLVTPDKEVLYYWDQSGSSYDYVRARKSTDHVGTWANEVILSGNTVDVSQPEGIVDSDGVATIVFRETGSPYKLWSIRQSPFGNWQQPQVAHATAQFFQAIEIASDDQGSTIVITDEGGMEPEVHSLVFDSITGSWSAPTRVSQVGQFCLLPTLAQNDSGSVVYLLYIVKSGGEYGMYAHLWMSEEQEWGEAMLLPGTSSVSYYMVGQHSEFPLVVGNDGEVTVFWQGIENDVATLFASRTLGGDWQTPHELLPPNSNILALDLENFSHADASDRGDVMGTFTRYNGNGGELFVAHYDVDAGWREIASPLTVPHTWTVESRGVFHYGERAMAMTSGSAGDVIAMRSTGQGWIEGEIDIPGSSEAWTKALVSVEGSVLFSYKSGGIKTTWFEYVIGDANCDQVVDVSDLLEVVSYLGFCEDPNIDCPADFDGNGVVDVGDLLLVVDRWGSGI